MVREGGLQRSTKDKRRATRKYIWLQIHNISRRMCFRVGSVRKMKVMITATFSEGTRDGRISMRCIEQD